MYCAPGFLAEGSKPLRPPGASLAKLLFLFRNTGFRHTSLNLAGRQYYALDTTLNLGSIAAELRYAAVDDQTSASGAIPLVTIASDQPRFVLTHIPLIWNESLPEVWFSGRKKPLARDQLSMTFAALADPTRRAILARLATGEASVADLAQPFDMTVRAVSNHIAVLEAAGLVTRGRDAQRRPSRIRLDPLADIDGWLEDYRQLWTRRFDKLDRRLATQLKEKNGGHGE